MPTIEQIRDRIKEVAPKRICIVKPSALGDVVQTLPILAPIKKHLPGVRITWVIRKELESLIACHPELDETICYDRKGGLSSLLGLSMSLRHHQFDLVLDLQGLLRTGLMTFMSRGKYRIGLETAREYSHWACHHTIPGTSKSVPAYERYWRILELFDQEKAERVLNLEFPIDARRRIEVLLSSLAKPILVINPGARWVTKRWPALSFAEVAKRANREMGVSIVLVGAPDERQICNQIVESLHGHVQKNQMLNLAGETSLCELAVVLQMAELILTNDSGPMHLGAELGTPVVGLFTCTSSVRSGPPGDQHELVDVNLSCAASYKKTCPHSGDDHMQCLNHLTVEQAWSAIRRAFEKNKLSGRAA